MIKTTFNRGDIVTLKRGFPYTPVKFLTTGGQYEVLSVREDDKYIQVLNDIGRLQVVYRDRFELAIAGPKTAIEMARAQRKEADAARKAKAAAKREAEVAANELPKLMTAPYGHVKKPQAPLLFTSLTHEDIYAAVANYIKAKAHFPFKVVDLDRTTEGFKITLVHA